MVWQLYATQLKTADTLEVADLNIYAPALHSTDILQILIPLSSLIIISSPFVLPLAGLLRNTVISTSFSVILSGTTYLLMFLPA